MRTKRGQALIELAIGMFTLAWVVSVLVVFAMYSIRSLRIQNHIRGSGGSQVEKIELGEFEQDTIFGVKSLKIKEPYAPPE